MFDHLFENRNSTVTHLLKLGDCLGRSLRENVELFSIDAEKKEVAFLTENGKVISGDYDLGDDIILENLQVRDVKVFSSNKTFNSFVDDKVSNFVGNLNSNKYKEAENSFSDILSLWENRLKFENVKKRLDEKVEVFNASQEILSTPEFQRFVEVLPQFTEFLSENKETINSVKEVENAVKLSNSVSKAFNFPRINYETLEEDGVYKISHGINKNIYELICKQELVHKELLESKKNFEEVWATNSKIRNLAGLIFEGSEDAILEALIEAVIDVPFLALATKKQLTHSIDNALGLVDYTSVSEKKIKAYASTIFEMKKPIKKTIIALLNEKYGINVLNLKEAVSFQSLANTQVVIFESLYRLAPKGSVIKDTLADLTKLLKNKNGVEVIDVNDLLQECFSMCEYGTFCEDYNIVDTLSFDTILESEYTPKELLEKAKTKKKKKKVRGKKGDDGDDDDDDEDSGDEELLLDKDKEGDDQGSPDEDPKKETKRAKKLEKHPESDRNPEDDSEALAKKKRPGTVKEDAEDEEEPEVEAPSQETQADQDPEGAEEDKSVSKEDFLSSLKDMEDLMSGNLGDDEESPLPDAEREDDEESEASAKAAEAPQDEIA